MAEEKSIAAAINDLTEEDLGGPETGTEIESEADDTILEEGAGEGAEGEGDPGWTGEEEGEQAAEAAEEGEAEGEGAEEGEGDGEGDEPDPTDMLLENLTAEEIERLKSDPALNTLRHKLLGNYNRKIQKAAQAIQLADMYEKDPVYVLNAIAKANGFTIQQAKAVAEAATEKAEDATGKTAEQRAQVDEAGAELEAMFGEKVGPKVRAVFDKYVGAMLQDHTAPLKEDLGRVSNQNRITALEREEAAFKAEHTDMTPEEEAAVVALGNSGEFVPGPNQSPHDFLNTLLTVVRAKGATRAAKTAKATASKDLARKIATNRRDREPRGRTGRGGNVKQVSKLLQPEKIRNMDEAFDIALEELKAEG